MSRQLKIDWDYDDRCEGVAREFAVMLAAHVAPGTPRETLTTLASRMAMVSRERFSKLVEPPEMIRCHCCDDMTGPDERARVIVCVRCGMNPRTPGSDG